MFLLNLSLQRPNFAQALCTSVHKNKKTFTLTHTWKPTRISKKYIIKNRFRKQNPSKKKRNNQKNSHNFCLTHEKSIPALSYISLHTLKKTLKLNFEKTAPSAILVFSAIFLFVFSKNTLLMPKNKQPQPQIENINTLLENINNVINLVPRRIRVPHPKHRKYEQIQIVIPSQLPCNLTYLPSPRPNLKKKRLRISSPNDKTKSNNSKSNRAKKKSQKSINFSTTFTVQYSKKFPNISMGSISKKTRKTR